LRHIASHDFNEKTPDIKVGFIETSFVYIEEALSEAWVSFTLTLILRFFASFYIVV